LHQLLNADLVLLSPQAQQWGNLRTFPRRRLFQAANLSAVESVAPLYVRGGFWKNPQTQRNTAILVLGFNPYQPAFKLPEIVQNPALLALPDTFMFDSLSNGPYQKVVAQVESGNPVTTELEGRRITIAGLYQVGASFVADGSVMTSDQNFRRIFTNIEPAEVSVGLIRLKPGSNASEVTATLNTQLEEDVRVLTLQDFIDVEETHWRNATAIGFIFTLGVGMGFIVGIIIVYQILYTDVSDHLPEYATFKAMGYRDRYLIGLVFQEAFILALSGFIPGYLISLGLYRLTSGATNLPIEMTTDRAIFVLVLTGLMCMVSGLVSMRKLRSADPADIF
jgi:putative ABC transport system permease protein